MPPHGKLSCLWTERSGKIAGRTSSQPGTHYFVCVLSSSVAGASGPIGFDPGRVAIRNADGASGRFRTARPREGGGRRDAAVRNRVAGHQLARRLIQLA